MKWLARLFSPRQPERPAPAKRAAAATSSIPPPPAAEATPFLPWLLGCGPLTDAPVAGPEQRALDALDKTLALPALPDDLLPRATALIPQLLALLRQTELPVPALAQRVAKDMVLAAEVLRLASSPYYRAQGAVTDLAQAIALIGVEGLQTVIARVVLKPMYDAPPGPLSARAGTRLWDHAEALAWHTAAFAGAAGSPAFDGYLAGLLHDSGWSMLLRVLDRAGVAPPLPPTAAFAAAAAERAHRLFGRAAQRWTITEGFTSFGADARERSLATSPHALAEALRQALPLAMSDVSSGAA